MFKDILSIVGSTGFGMKKLDVLRLGTVDYRVALKLQYNLLEKRIKKEIPNTLVLLQHPHTFTIGRGGSSNNLLVEESFLKKNNITFERIGRGGDITYHGPGQLVGYPILDLSDYGKDIHSYLRTLEKVLILTLKDFGIEARRIEKLTGVWVKRSKIASIGVGVRRWVTYHGFALNVNTDLSYFNLIIPCGIPKVKMTSMKEWLGLSEDVDMESVSRSLVSFFCELFNLSIENTIDLAYEYSDYDLLIAKLEKELAEVRV